MDVAREPGIQSKIIVRSVAGMKDPVRSCLGKGDERLTGLRAELNEFIWFVAFSDDAKVFLVDCLGIPRDKLYSVDIDCPGKRATLVVQDGEAAAMAIGSKGINVKLAIRITGLEAVQILTPDQAQSSQKPQLAKSPEELLEEAINQEIPEVSKGIITLVDMVREPGIQSKVIVRQSAGREAAVPICVGKDMKHLKALSRQFGEPVRFVEFHKDLEGRLVACLGIHIGRVVSVNVNPNLQTADVLVTDRATCAKAIGENGVNVKQAAQLSGLRYIRIQPRE